MDRYGYVGRAYHGTRALPREELVRFHGLLKRVDDQYLDPLELRSDSTLGVPGLLGEDCLSGECAHEMKALLEQDVDPSIPYTSVFSIDDGVIDVYKKVRGVRQALEAMRDGMPAALPISMGTAAYGSLC